MPPRSGLMVLFPQETSGILKYGKRIIWSMDIAIAHSVYMGVGIRWRSMEISQLWIKIKERAIERLPDEEVLTALRSKDFTYIDSLIKNIQQLAELKKSSFDSKMPDIRSQIELLCDEFGRE
jgi:hypothetical protein